MKSKVSATNKMVAVSVLFTLILLTLRIIVSGQLNYIFFAWNLFLATIPLMISNQLLKQHSLSLKVYIMLTAWLLFLPNAPYIITDIFHFKERPPVPLWFDLLVVTSAAWNGLIIGIISLLQVDRFLHRHIRRQWVYVIVVGCLMLSAFGIYLGRFLRFNSWDVLTNPFALLSSIFYRVHYPFDHLRTWGFTLLFGGLLSIAYFTIKSLAYTGKRFES